MSEIEIHQEHGHDSDSFGRRIGLVAALLGALLGASGFLI